MSLGGDVIASLGAEECTLFRRALGTSAKGRYTPNAVETTETILVGHVPATGKDLERLPEGMRTSETRRLFTTTQLLVAPHPDRVVIPTLGVTPFEVQHVEPWTSGGFYDCVAVRVAE